MISVGGFFCCVLYFTIPLVNCVVIQDQNGTHEKLFWEMYNRQIVPRATEEYKQWIVPDKSPNCDWLFSEDGMYFCRNCYFNENSLPCNLAMVGKPNNRIRMTICHQIKDMPETNVYDGENGINLLDEEISKEGCYTFESTARSLYMRMPSDRLKTIPHTFLFQIETLQNKAAPETSDLKMGCVGHITIPGTIDMPYSSNGQPFKTECFWTANTTRTDSPLIQVSLPERICEDYDDENCFLRYVRIYTSEGAKKQRLFDPYLPSKLVYFSPASSVTIEYFGCTFRQPGKITVDFFK